MRTGTVKRFHEEKGFGFITPDDGSEEIYFSYTEIQTVGPKTVKEGQRVTYEIALGTSGRLFAIQILPR
ncbi:cold shock protein [Bacillus thuringiensis]|nr:cold shock domain-containing protein [Bacillus cereus]